MKKRVAIIIPGGIGTGKANMGVPVMEGLVLGLSREFDITVYSLFKINQDYQPKGFKLIGLSRKNLLLNTLHLIYLFLKEDKKSRYEIIHGFWALPSGILAVVLGKLFNIRSVVSVLGGDATALPKISYGQLRNRIPRSLVLWTLNRADEVIALTHFQIDFLRKNGFKREAKIIPWGVDIQQFSFREKSAGSPVKFLHVANLHPVKDQITLLHAFQIISQKISARLTIIGEDQLNGKIQLLAAQLGLDSCVTFLGSLPYEIMPKAYHNSDFLLHTSLWEGQSEVVTEAMSCGVIVCGTSVGLMADYPDCCLGVPVGDYRLLAERVVELIKDSERTDFYRSNAHHFTLRHSISWTVQKTKDVYQTTKISLA